ncbi:MAG: hypothetical protein HY615_01750 [Candidatus Rokubacteria bacterium]|nr:hypothetical protein [Candidatus Rokubacteria bacterium]
MAQRRNRPKRESSGGSPPKKPELKLEYNLRPIVRDLLQIIKSYRSGRPPGRPGWRDFVRDEIVEGEGLTTGSEVWKKLRRYAAQRPKAEVVKEIVENNRACSELPGRVHPKGLHVHLYDDRTRLIVAVSHGTIKNFVSKLRKHSTKKSPS